MRKGGKMMAMGFGMILMVLLGGGGNDLLDFVSPAAYWKAKGVKVTTKSLLAELRTVEAGGDVSDLIKQLGAKEYKVREKATRRLRAMGPAALPELREAAKSSDPEVAIRAERIMRNLSGGAGARSVRRLMAIRSLGELKDRQAVPALRNLLKSKAVFEAEYAAAAIAAIAGKPFKRPAASARAMQSDLWLLPAGCGAVGQASLRPGSPITTRQILKALGPMLGDTDTEAALAQINEGLISIVERVGNVRLDGATFGVADNIGDNSGYVVIVAHGLYDPAAVRAVLMKQRAKIEKMGRTEILRLDENAAMILASNERLVFMAGPAKEQLPIKQLAAALESGKGKLAGNEAMVTLIRSVDTTSPVWAVARVSEAYRKASVLAPFETLTLVGKRKAGRMDFALKARGSDAEKVAQAVEEFNKLMAEGREQLARMAEQMPAFKPLADFVASIKAAADGTNATATAQLKGDLKTLLGVPLLMFSMGKSSAEAEGMAEMNAQQAAEAEKLRLEEAKRRAMEEEMRARQEKRRAMEEERRKENKKGPTPR